MVEYAPAFGHYENTEYISKRYYMKPRNMNYKQEYKEKNHKKDKKKKSIGRHLYFLLSIFLLINYYYQEEIYFLIGAIMNLLFYFTL
jgi:hypothetical protein